MVINVIIALKPCGNKAPMVMELQEGPASRASSMLAARAVNCFKTAPECVQSSLG